MKITTVFQYDEILPAGQWQITSSARMESARLWNRMVKLHQWFRRKHKPWPQSGDFEKHFKGRFALHSQAIQALIKKFFALIDGVRTAKANGNDKAKYPYRSKKRFVNAIWKGQSIKRHGNRNVLPMGRSEIH